MHQITKQFPGVLALDKVDFDLYPGEVHILLGENGAGKSTLMKTLAGAHEPDSGTIVVDGREVRIRNPKQAQALGISIIYQEFTLIPYLTVAQNIFLAREPLRWGMRGLVDRDRLYADSTAILKTLGISVDPRSVVSTLGVAQQQLVEVAKALSLNARILIMDEPTATLSDQEIEQLFGIIHNLKSRGVGVIYISHRLQEVGQIGDRVTVLRDGRSVGTYNVADVDINTLIKLMVGREVMEKADRRSLPNAPEALRVSHLHRNGVLHDVNLVVREGEIVGLAGLVGSGRTELARAIFGIDPFDSGEIVLLGKRLVATNPSLSIRLGLGLLPEDRKSDGLALILPVKDNVTHASLTRLFPSFILDFRKERAIAERYVRDLRIATPNIFRQVGFLSGGNQQKVVLAKWLATQSRVLIFDEPTRGIDVGAKAEVHDFMRQLARQGVAILMISSDLPEIVSMSDRVYVMREGTIVKELEGEDINQETIIGYAMGKGEGQ
ncbi:MAG TPA: sugar ABC transporter ATP-binding protein [Firmicutes bacterium]|nr:sugar ABC transporter ATP-binding protein [Bacillota bacterium]